MQLFLTHEGQTWSINPYVSASFRENTLRVFSSLDSGLVYSTAPAKLGESYHVQVFGHEKNPVVKKADMPDNRGARILWALSFVEPEKRVSSEKDFFQRQASIEAEYASEVSIIHYLKDGYAFFLAKKRPQPGKGRKSHQTKYKPCLGWCSDDISEENLKDLVQKFRKYRKIYCPVEFLFVI